MLEYDATCPICLQNQRFRCLDDYFSSRDGLSAETCPFGHCVTRERALAYVIRRLYGETELVRLRIHESSPADRGMSMWFAKHCPRYLQSGFYPDRPIGDMIGQIRNENLERQSFADALFDLVVHLDVMEHLFDPFQALREIYRTLAAGGKCVFTVPTQADKFESVQVAYKDMDNKVKTIGDPEFHADPFSKTGVLVTWRFGYDLPLLISRETPFDVEVHRFQQKKSAITGWMTEVYVLSK